MLLNFASVFIRPVSIIGSAPEPGVSGNLLRLIACCQRDEKITLNVRVFQLPFVCRLSDMFEALSTPGSCYFHVLLSADML